MSQLSEIIIPTTDDGQGGNMTNKSATQSSNSIPSDFKVVKSRRKNNNKRNKTEAEGELNQIKNKSSDEPDVEERDKGSKKSRIEEGLGEIERSKLNKKNNENNKDNEDSRKSESKELNEKDNEKNQYNEIQIQSENNELNKKEGNNQKNENIGASEKSKNNKVDIETQNKINEKKIDIINSSSFFEMVQVKSKLKEEVLKEQVKSPKVTVKREVSELIEPEEKEIFLEEDIKIEILNDYLLQIFNDWLNDILLNESYLFSDEEIDTFNKYLKLDELSQYLLLRVYLRKHGWIKKESLLDYCIKKRVKNQLDDSLNQLIKEQFFILFSSGRSSLEELIAMMTLPQLKTIVKGEKWFDGFKSKPKDIITQKLILHCKNQPSLFAFSNWKLKNNNRERIQLNLNIRQLFDRLQLAYHRTLPLNQCHLTKAILVQSNKLCFPKYQVSRNRQFFLNQQHFLNFEYANIMYHITIEAFHMKNEKEFYYQIIKEIANECYEQWQKEIEFFDNYKLMDYQLNYTAGYLFTKIQEIKLRVLANEKKYLEESELLQILLKQKIYRIKKRGIWYNRLGLILQNYFKKDKDKLKLGFDICIKGLNDSLLNLDDKEMIYDRLRKIKNINITFNFQLPLFKKPTTIELIAQKLLNNCKSAKTRRIYRSTDGSENTIEELALDHFKKQGYIGYHCEGKLITTLFIYLFWDILFMPVSNVFETQYQSQPLDFMSKCFYQNRKEVIETHLSYIKTGMGLSVLKKNYNEINKTLVKVVGFDPIYSLLDLTSIVKYLPVNGLINIMRKLIMDYNYYFTGFPDLTLIHLDKKYVRFAEVKGPGDILSFKQKTWLRDLSDNDIQADVIYFKVKDDDDYLSHSE
ncbi:hypothetical protein K502DRAFT_322697 [Neoconidiobolus thromboides FSU 785]|nr:hypothetical protein K502DRAFT_322697 [Neoconidiobolus thromboides FSU 785]